MTEIHPGAARVVGWMLHEGRINTHMREFGDDMCRRVVEAGIPLWRAFCGIRTLHPQIAATAYVWRRGQGTAERRTALHGIEKTPAFTQSPLAEVSRSGRMMRQRLDQPGATLAYKVLEEFRAEGGTDYVAMPMTFSSGEINSISWLTDRAGGFSDLEIAGLAEVAEMLTVVIEVQTHRRITGALMDTYVGHRTGQRVLSGAVKRGDGETVRAVIWFCDLRGFTRLSDTLPRELLLDLLNEYFEIMVKAVATEGGEVLKFIGDGMLAIFELREHDKVAERCAAALRAARTAQEAVATRNPERIAADHAAIRYGLALHLGEVTYGNIGAPNRLDFTVIGPAVNHATRIEKLAGKLDRRVVMSASFAAAAEVALTSLGTHALAGVSEPQEVFTLPD
ncbi:MAG TPA: adenylate/guanylate cyclase domain-containing protein [Candidatus Binataceae bacterium]|jgi:adenylate cyclase|nr:adenylate/guanylate cyclase domain-containing protein [Candidatus Binataceae bacterium]